MNTDRHGTRSRCCSHDGDDQAVDGRLRLVLLLASGILTGLGLVLHWTDAGEAPERLAFAVALVTGGWFIAPHAWLSLRRLSPDMNLLMTMAAVGALFIDAWDEAASVVFLFSLSETLESFSMKRARRAISSLMTLAPDTALVERGDGWVAVPASEIRPGDVFLVKPGERIALDGDVLDGRSTVNQAPITGESMPAEKSPGDAVFAGTINEHGSLKVRASKPASDSTLARIIHLVEEAQSRKAPAQRFVDDFARYYTPAIFAVAILLAVIPPLVLGHAWRDWFYRGLVVLVIGCPCALVISTPVAIISALTAAARHGVLIKGGAVLEALGMLKALAVDKTGTMTEGRPRVRDVIPLNGRNESDVLRLAASLDAHSEHPLAAAIVDYARGRGVAPEAVADFRAWPGRGVTGRLGGRLYFLGNHRLVEERSACSPAVEDVIASVETSALTAVLAGTCAEADQTAGVVGIVAIGDAVRPEAADAVAALKRLDIEPIVMLSGDNRATAEAIRARVGIDEAHGELLPQEKVERVRNLQARFGYAGMVGDGINDAPALAAASVGIAMGTAGSDAALETADVALMGDDLTKLPEAVRLGRKARRIVQANIAFALAVKAVFFGLAASGHATLWMAVASDMGASLLVILNGLRLLWLQDKARTLREPRLA